MWKRMLKAIDVSVDFVLLTMSDVYNFSGESVGEGGVPDKVSASEWALPKLVCWAPVRYMV